MSTARRVVVGVAMTVLVMARVASAQQSIVHAFQDLQLTPGQQVLVRTADGKTVGGMFVSVVGEQLEIRRIRWLILEERRGFAQSAVEQIKINDSVWNGALAGAGAGLLGAVLIGQVCPDCLLPAVFSISVGPGVGMAIDKAINRTIYTSATSKVVGFTVGPLVARDRLGVTLRMRLR